MTGPLEAGSVEARIIEFALDTTLHRPAPAPVVTLIDATLEALGEIPFEAARAESAALELFDRLRPEYAPCTAEIMASVVACAATGSPRSEEAAVAGIELGVRIADLIHSGTPSGWWHPVGTSSVLAGALAGAAAHEMDAVAASSVLALAASQAAALDGDEPAIRAYRITWSTSAAIESIYNVQSSFVAAVAGLTGSHGLLSVLGCDEPADQILAELGEVWLSVDLLTASRCRWHSDACDSNGDRR